MAEHFVGRSAELTALLGLLGAGPGLRVAAVTGEPGIGKTRLLQELRDSAERSGRSVLTDAKGRDTSAWARNA